MLSPRLSSVVLLSRDKENSEKLIKYTTLILDISLETCYVEDNNCIFIISLF